MTPSTYYAVKTRVPSARARSDAVMTAVLTQLWQENYRVYGAHKRRKAARRAGPRHRPRPGRSTDAGRRDRRTATANGCAPPNSIPERHAILTW